MNAPENLPARSGPTVADDVKAELLRRRATLEHDRKTARPWDDIYAELRRKLSGPR